MSFSWEIRSFFQQTRRPSLRVEEHKACGDPFIYQSLLLASTDVGNWKPSISSANPSLNTSWNSCFHARAFLLLNIRNTLHAPRQNRSHSAGSWNVSSSQIVRSCGRWRSTSLVHLRWRSAGEEDSSGCGVGYASCNCCKKGKSEKKWCWMWMDYVNLQQYLTIIPLINGCVWFSLRATEKTQEHEHLQLGRFKNKTI